MADSNHYVLFNKCCSCYNIFYFRIVETGYYSEHKAAEALRQICEALEVSVLNSLHWILCKPIADDLGGKMLVLMVLPSNPLQFI